MKKIVLSLMLVFATSSLVNAMNMYQPDECAELADAVTASVEQAISGYAEHTDYLDLWSSAYDACLFAAIRDMEDIEEEEE